MPVRKNISASDTQTTAFSIHLENPLAAPGWDRLIAQQPEVSLFHHTAWARVVAETYGFTPVYLSTGGNQHPAATLPVMEVDSWLTGKRGVCLPFTDECEPADTSGTFSSSLVAEAVRQGHARGWKYLELRGGKNPFKGTASSLTFHGHRLKLSADHDLLFNHFDSSVRRALRKSEKSGVQVEFSHSLQATPEYYHLHCHTRRAHGLPPQPLRFFRNLHTHLIAKNHGVVVTARLQNQPLAAAIYLYHGRAAIYKFGASSQAALDLRPNNLVMWEAIKWLAARGVEQLSFGRTSTHNEGLRRYKLGWGAEEYAIHYYRYDLRHEKMVPLSDESTGWHNTFFHILPVPLARCAGEILYRHVA